jgi:hypothetical protein
VSRMRWACPATGRGMRPVASATTRTARPTTTAAVSRRVKAIWGSRLYGDDGSIRREQRPEVRLSHIRSVSGQATRGRRGTRPMGNRAVPKTVPQSMYHRLPVYMSFWYARGTMTTHASTATARTRRTARRRPVDRVLWARVARALYRASRRVPRAAESERIDQMSHVARVRSHPQLRPRDGRGHVHPAPTPRVFLTPI